jgi:predicted dehydrogenase
LEKCCHDIDLLNWILDSVPTKVSAEGGLDIFIPENQPADPRIAELYEMWDFAWENVDAFNSDKSIEDNLIGIMKYRNGAKVSFHTNCNAAFPQRRMLFCGVKGTLEADLISSHIRYQVIGQQRQEMDVIGEGGHGGGDDKFVFFASDSIYRA